MGLPRRSSRPDQARVPGRAHIALLRRCTPARVLVWVGVHDGAASVSKGSEQISTRWLNGQTEFSCCGRKIVLRMVGRVHNKVEYRGKVGYVTSTEVYCMECRR